MEMTLQQCLAPADAVVIFISQVAAPACANWHCSCTLAAFQLTQLYCCISFVVLSTFTWRR